MENWGCDGFVVTKMRTVKDVEDFLEGGSVMVKGAVGVRVGRGG